MEILEKAGILKNFYLAGGTGLAFQLNHRLSHHLDFFTNKDINIKFIIRELKNLGKLSIENESENSLTCNFNTTIITFLEYDYPCLFVFKNLQGIKIADSRDIGCMKIDAISSGGTKRDFIELFYICKKVISLDELIILFQRKYKNVEYNMIHIFKSLLYFEDAEKEPMPRTITSTSWKDVKNYFKKEVKRLN
ncbi:MAG: hypothetical protein FJW69_06865 [Actinobacteria bacterium]|nr:hypothetical protein [Actinomycetota bacterium]